MSARLQFLQLDAVGAQPLAVRVFAGELLFDFAVVVNLALLRVYQQNLSWLQSAFSAISVGSKSITPTSLATIMVSFLVMV